MMAISAAACNGSTTSTTSGGPLDFHFRFNPRNLTFSARLVPFGAMPFWAHFAAEALNGSDRTARRRIFLVWRPSLPGRVMSPKGACGDEFVTTAAATTTAGVTWVTTPPLEATVFRHQQPGRRVDEPDIAATDGNRHVSIIEGVMRLVDVTGDEPDLGGRVAPRVRVDTASSSAATVPLSSLRVTSVPMFAADAARIAPAAVRR